MEDSSISKKKCDSSSTSSASLSASSTASVRNVPIIQAHLESQLNVGEKSNMQFQIERPDKPSSGAMKVAPWLSGNSEATSIVAASVQAVRGFKNPFVAGVSGACRPDQAVTSGSSGGAAVASVSNLIRKLQAQAPDPQGRKAEDPPGIEACGTDDEPREKEGGTGKSSPKSAAAALLSKLTTPSPAASAAPVPPKGQPAAFDWNACYMQLAAFKQVHGHANPTSGHLAGWLACQRVLYRQGLHPSAVQVQLLQAMGAFGFAPPLASGANPMMGNPMLMMGAAMGRLPAMIPPRPTVMAGRPALASVGAPPKALTARKLPLSSNAATDTTNKNNNKPSSSPPSRPTKNPNKPTTQRPSNPAVRGGTSWEDRFQQLLAYQKRMGTPNPPQTKGSPEPDYKLAVWLNSQRQKFRKRTLADDKTEQLRELGCEGFVPLEDDTDGDKKSESGPNKKRKANPVVVEEQQPTKVKRKKVSWVGRYQELCEFKERVGHANPNYGKGSPDACQHLAQWLSNQRSDFRLGKKISLDQVKMLRKLGCRGFDKAPYEEDEEAEAVTTTVASRPPPKKIVYPTPQDP